MLRFGTDGVRGVALREITPSAVQYFARAAARALRFPEVVVGHDPRESSPVLARAVIDGFRAEGVSVVDLGTAPTPAVAHAAAVRGSGAAVITASHNPYTDNGLKFFGVGGLKLGDADEAAIQRGYEAFVAGDARFVEFYEPAPALSLAGYVAHVVASGVDVKTGLRVVVDCANGAMSNVAADVFAALSIDATVYNASPSGTNINVGCGAAHAERLAELVLRHDCDLGIAFDGDGDRLIAATPNGTIVDGDHIIAIAANDLRRRGLLTNDAVVVTVMSNLGFQRAMAASNITVHRTPVGDRSVLIEMERSGAVLGGEQSGHIIHRGLATTGDGLLASVQLIGALSRSSATIGEAASAAMTSYPQVLINVRVSSNAKSIVDACADVIAAVESQLGSDGRVLVRASGTEPLVRVMVEASDEVVAREAAQRIADRASVVEG